MYALASLLVELLQTAKYPSLYSTSAEEQHSKDVNWFCNAVHGRAPISGSSTEDCYGEGCHQ